MWTDIMATTLQQIIKFLSTLESAYFAIFSSVPKGRADIQTLLQS
jgi:hypothetical protein